MAKEYIIYFELKRAILTESIEHYFINDFGLFVSYASPQDLSKVLDFFKNVSQVGNVFITGKEVDQMFNDLTSLNRMVEAAGGLVVNSKGEYLMIFRRGKWDLPKGKVDNNESIEDTAIREVAEETGVSKLRINKHLIDTYHTYSLDDNTIIKKTSWFEMSSNGNDKLVPQVDEDIVEARWVSRDQLEEVLTNTYDTILEVFKSARIV